MLRMGKRWRRKRMWWYITRLGGEILVRRLTIQNEEVVVVVEKRRVNSVKRNRQNRIQRHLSLGVRFEV